MRPCPKYLDHIRSNESNATVPVLRRVIQHIIDPEVGVVLSQTIEILLEQNIIRIHIGEDKVHLCPVAGLASPANGLDDLKHGRDTRSTRNHTNMSAHVGRIHHCALGSLDAHCLTDHEGRHVLADVAGGVGFDEDIEEAPVFIGGDGSVGPHDVGAVDFGSEGNVLADWETEDVGLTGEFEPVSTVFLALANNLKPGSRTWRYYATELSSP